MNTSLVLLLLLVVVSFLSTALADSFGQWFDDQHSEVTDTPYSIKVQFYNGETSLPPSLTKPGSLIRLGPTILNTPKTNYTNYVDGFGRISKWEFGAGGDNVVSFQSAIIKSSLWNNSKTGSEIPPHITAEKTNPSSFAIVQLENMDNTDVFPFQFPSQKDKITINTDFYESNQIHLGSLRTLGSTEFKDDVKGTFSASHIAEYVDSATGKLYRVDWLGAMDLAGTDMNMYKMSDDYVRQLVGSYHLGYLPYSIHQTVVVGDYAIIYASPVKLNFLETGFDACLSCSTDDKLDSEDSIWLIFDLKSNDPKAKPQVIKTPKDSNFFVFHYANGKFTEGSNKRKIDLDTCAYNSMAGVLGEHVLGNIKDVMSPDIRNSMPYFCDSFKRVTLDLDTSTISARMDFPLQDSVGNKYRVELLSINNNYLGKNYCYAYALTFHVNGSPLYEDMGVLKINLCTAASVALGSLPANTATVEVFSQKNLYLGEPIFVASPTATSEDDGHLLVVSRDGNDNKTKLIVLDAKTLQLTASATAPFPTMFEFHGAYFPQN